MKNFTNISVQSIRRPLNSTQGVSNQCVRYFQSQIIFIDSLAAFTQIVDDLADLHELSNDRSQWSMRSR